MRPPGWSLAGRWGLVVVLGVAAVAATVNGSTPSGATPPAAGSGPALSAADNAWKLHDHWRPGRRGEGTDGEDWSGNAAGPDSEEGGAAETSASAHVAATTPWTPSTPLPAPAADGRHVVVVLSPHPDDETLSLGVWIANAEAEGDRVVVVALTDGRSTGAIDIISGRIGHELTRDQIAAARIRELQQAAQDLGVAPGDVYRAGLDGDATPGGSRVTVEEASAVIRAFAERFPQATFATMSWVAEQHPDHLNAGRALHDAVTAGVVHDARFAISRLWWGLPSPTATDVQPATPTARERVLAAAEAYDLWDPAHERYSVGWLSVRSQFTALIADPRDRFHGN